MAFLLVTDIRRRRACAARPPAREALESSAGALLMTSVPRASIVCQRKSVWRSICRQTKNDFDASFELVTQIDAPRILKIVYRSQAFFIDPRKATALGAAEQR